MHTEQQVSVLMNASYIQTKGGVAHKKYRRNEILWLAPLPRPALVDIDITHMTNILGLPLPFLHTAINHKLEGELLGTKLQSVVRASS